LDALYDFFMGGQGFEVVHGLEVEPGDGVAAKIAGESLGGIGRYGTALLDNFVDAVAGTPKAMARALALMSRGSRKSSRSISPGWTGGMLFMGRVILSPQ
jgi:hypothetical protein